MIIWKAQVAVEILFSDSLSLALVAKAYFFRWTKIVDLQYGPWNWTDAVLADEQT